MSFIWLITNSLSAAVADDLLNNCPRATLSYHFFRDDHAEPLADVLRHLAYQHLSQPTGTSKLAINLHQKSKATKAPLLPKDIAKILCDIASTSHCTYIVLDGVDEFPYAAKLMKHFPEFVAAGARLFIAGRDIPSISASLACTNPSLSTPALARRIFLPTSAGDSRKTLSWTRIHSTTSCWRKFARSLSTMLTDRELHYAFSPSAG